MSKGTTFRNDLLKFIFNATPIAHMADNAASAPYTDYYIALHTSSPGVGGSQTTNEVSGITGYTRLPVVRTSSGWTVSTNTATNAADAVFGACTAGGPATVTHFSIGTDVSGAGKILYVGDALADPVVYSLGNPEPQFAAGDLVVTET